MSVVAIYVVSYSTDMDYKGSETRPSLSLRHRLRLRQRLVVPHILFSFLLRFSRLLVLFSCVVRSRLLTLHLTFTLKTVPTHTYMDGRTEGQTDRQKSSTRLSPQHSQCWRDAGDWNTWAIVRTYSHIIYILDLILTDSQSSYTRSLVSVVVFAACSSNSWTCI